MKDFTYVVYDDFDDNFNFDSLRAHACTWLTNMGLNETRWILDSEWILSFVNNITYEKWVREKC